MQALIADAGTDELRLTDVDDLTPGHDELLLDVRAAGVNRADLLQRAGLYPPPPGESEIIGLECAGTVRAVGAHVTGWRVGDRVCALLPGGGYSTQVVVPAGLAMPLPDRLSFEQAAALPEVFLTAFLNLVVLANLAKGEHVLIHAGASGVGTAAIQIARELGAVPIVTAGSPEKLLACRELGAAVAIDYTAGGFADAVLDATQGNGADVVLDPVGASYWEQNLACIAEDGRWVIIGGLGGYEPQVNIRALMRRRLQLSFSTLRSRSTTNKVAIMRRFTEFASARIADGRLTPVIDRVYDWADVMAAHARVEANQNIGKVVITMANKTKETVE